MFVCYYYFFHTTQRQVVAHMYLGVLPSMPTRFILNRQQA
jgi:hypothetical protein